MVGSEDDRFRLEEFCRVQYPRLVGMLGLHCGDRQTGEDLAQETLARVWRRWARVGGMDDPEQWCRRVGFNLANSWFRRQRLARRHVLPATAESPAQRAGDGFARAVAGLPERQRMVVILRFYEDRSVADTACLLGIREGTVRALCAQAVARLREQPAAIEELRP